MDSKNVLEGYFALQIIRNRSFLRLNLVAMLSLRFVDEYFMQKLSNILKHVVIIFPKI